MKSRQFEVVLAQGKGQLWAKGGDNIIISVFGATGHQKPPGLGVLSTDRGRSE